MQLIAYFFVSYFLVGSQIEGDRLRLAVSTVPVWRYWQFDLVGTVPTDSARDLTPPIENAD